MPIGRRPLLKRLLLSTWVLASAACVRPNLRPSAPAVVPPPAVDAWNLEAHGILSDVLQSLRTFDAYQAFRVGLASESSLRLSSELAWDPPTSADWDEATHVTRGVRGRADLLFQAVTTGKIDPSLWREQRALADASHDLLDLGEVLSAYRDRLDGLPPGDGSNALSLLDAAWARWDKAAARWTLSRSELVPCQS